MRRTLGHPFSHVSFGLSNPRSFFSFSALCSRDFPGRFFQLPSTASTAQVTPSTASLAPVDAPSVAPSLGRRPQRALDQKPGPVGNARERETDDKRNVDSLRFVFTSKLRVTTLPYFTCLLGLSHDRSLKKAICLTSMCLSPSCSRPLVCVACHMPGKRKEREREM